jgi:hypothetical protein
MSCAIRGKCFAVSCIVVRLGETAPDTPVLDILDEVVEALVGARGLARCARVLAGRPPDRGVADVAS